MLGSEVIYKAEIPEGTIMIKSQQFEFKNGDEVTVSVNKEHLYFFDENENRIRENLDPLYEVIKG